MADTVSKLLSMCLLVSRLDFGKLTAAQQTEVLTGSTGKPIVFVDNFIKLRSKRDLVDRLVNGEDVSMELEFNEIALTEDEAKALAAVRPVIERIRGASGKYSWIVRTEDQERSCKRNISFDDYGSGRVQRNGYGMTKKQAKNLWDAASAQWGGDEKAEPYNGSFEGYKKTVTIKDDVVIIGCQETTRYEVEYVAEHFDWEPNLK